MFADRVLTSSAAVWMLARSMSSRVITCTGREVSPSIFGTMLEPVTDTRVRCACADVLKSPAALATSRAYASATAILLRCNLIGGTRRKLKRETLLLAGRPTVATTQHREFHSIR